VLHQVGVRLNAGGDDGDETGGNDAGHTDDRDDGPDRCLCKYDFGDSVMSAGLTICQSVAGAKAEARLRIRSMSPRYCSVTYHDTDNHRDDREY
jgi:hypothetical protein